MEEKEQEETVPDPAVSNVCVWGDNTGASRAVPQRMSICEGKGVPEERQNMKACVRRGMWEREGNEQRTPKRCVWKCAVLQGTARLCGGSESLVHLLKSPPELSIELLQLRLLIFQPCNCFLQNFQPLQQEPLLREPRQLLPFCKSLLGRQRGDDVSWCHVKARRARTNTSGRVTRLGNGQPPRPFFSSWSTGQNNTLPSRVPPPDHLGETQTNLPSCFLDCGTRTSPVPKKAFNLIRQWYEFRYF